MRRHTYRILAATTSAFAIAGMLAAPAAWAQDETGPDSAACAAAEKEITNSGLQAQIDSFTAGPPGTPSLAELEQAVADGIAADNAAELTEDSAETTEAKNALAAREDLVSEAQSKLTALVSARDEACAEPDTGADDQGDDNTGGDDQQNDDAGTDQDGRNEDLDCADFPLADGRTAQDVLGADPSDPHRLDAEGDGLACEVDEQEDTTDTAGQDGTNNGGDVTGDDTTSDANTGGDETTGVLYENCAAVRDAGNAPLFATDDGYRPELDSDGDGVACETSTLYNPSDNGESDGDYSQTGDVPVGSAETGQA